MQKILINEDIEKNRGKDFYEDCHDDLGKFVSYYEQVRLTRKYSNKYSKMLEVGIGIKVLYNYLKECGKNIKSLDINKRLEPDYCLDISKGLPFKDKEFDIVMCFQTLENVPFKKAVSSLINMKRISNYVIISIPYRKTGFGFGFKLPLFKRRDFFIHLPNILRREYLIGVHYWEMGEKGYSENTIKSKFRSLGFEIVEEFVNPLIPNKYFFVFKSLR